MKYIRYNNVNDFLDKSLEYMEKDEAANNLMLGVCFRLQDGGKYGDAEPYFGVVEDAKGIVLAAVMTPPNPLLLHGQDYDEKALEVLAENLIKDNIAVPGVIGEKDLALNFAQVWAGKNNTSFTMDMNMRVYILNKVNEMKNISGHFRRAKEEDKNLVAQWIYNFDRDAVVGEATMEEALNMAEKKIIEGELYLWEEKVPVAMAASSRKTRNGIVVSLVYTPKEFRGKGYASGCVASLSKLLLEKGYKFCALFTDLANPTSNSIYMKIGYKPICDFDRYTFVKTGGE